MVSVAPMAYSLPSRADLTAPPTVPAMAIPYTGQVASAAMFFVPQWPQGQLEAQRQDQLGLPVPRLPQQQAMMLVPTPFFVPSQPPVQAQLPRLPRAAEPQQQEQPEQQLARVRDIDGSTSSGGPTSESDLAHIGTVERCYATCKSKDVEGLVTHLRRATAPDLTLKLSATNREIHGRCGVESFFSKLLRSIPDWTYNLQEVRTDGPSRVEVQYTVSGTQIRPFLPLFPLGKNVQYQGHAVFEFDPMDAVKKHTIRYSLIPNIVVQPSVVEGLSDVALMLSSTASGSHLLQDAMDGDGIDNDGRAQLVHQLRGHVWAAAASPHGNHVLQKFISSVPSAFVQFVVNELQGRAVEAAENQKRSRVIQRLLEYSPIAQTKGLVEEVLAEVAHLCTHPFGNFVVQSILEHGDTQHRSAIIKVLCEDAERYARHRVASNVVRVALTTGSLEDLRALVHVVAPDRDSLMSLSKHKCGSFVAREIKLLAKARGLSASV